MIFLWMTEMTACLNADKNGPVEWGKMMMQEGITPVILDDATYTSAYLGLGKFEIQIVLS